MSGGWSGVRRSFPAAMRRRILSRDPVCRCPGCASCAASGCSFPSVVADHVRNHADCVRAGVDPDTEANGQGMCAACHDVKTRRETLDGQRRYSPRRRRRAHPSEI